MGFNFIKDRENSIQFEVYLPFKIPLIISRFLNVSVGL